MLMGRCRSLAIDAARFDDEVDAGNGGIGREKATAPLQLQGWVPEEFDKVEDPVAFKFHSFTEQKFAAGTSAVVRKPPGGSNYPLCGNGFAQVVDEAHGMAYHSGIGEVQEFGNGPI